jgi:hypothetical protein
MKTQVIGGLVGGVILFVWGALVWDVFPLHSSWMKTAANEDSILAVMKESMGPQGVYLLPAMPVKSGRTPEELKTAEKEWARKVEAGPNVLVVYHPAGMSSMESVQMIAGLLISCLSAFVASWLLARSTAFNEGYLARVAFCGVLGVFISLVTHLANFNWFGYPGDYTTAMILDSVGGWVLAGLGIAAIVKYRQPSAGTANAAR